MRSSTDLVGSEMATTFHAHTVTPGVPFIRVTRRGNISGRVSPSAGSRRRALFPHCEGSTCATHAHASPDLMWRYRDTGALIQSDGPVRAHYLSRQIVCASISLNSLVSRQRKGKQIKKSIDRKPLKFPLLLHRVVRGLGLLGDVLLGRLQDGLSRSDPVTH